MSIRFSLLLCSLLFFPVSIRAQQPLKVFVLVGQSNMQGHAHVRTLEHLGMDPASESLHQAILDEQGTPRVYDDVWVAYLSNQGEKYGPLSTGFGADDSKLGPELTFGIAMRQALNEPILIIKTAWGGKSLHTDFRPPSAGAYTLNDSQIEQLQRQGKDIAEAQAERGAASGAYYRLTVDFVQRVLANLPELYPDYNPQAGYQLAGVVWFQGWNDMVDRGVYPNRDQPGGYAEYSQLLGQLIRDLRQDLAAPDLPFVIGVLGVNGPVSEYAADQQRYAAVHQHFRDAMAAPAAMPEFKDTVANVLTEKHWDRELSDLRDRETQVKQRAKKLQSEQGLDSTALSSLQTEMLAKELTPRQREILEKGISNGEYHYLGSAKIMTHIGQGFAEAMQRLLRENR
ncbi:MAG: sialate O-acetylesterase [bacterium]|nr:sialate O-acetylesterase [bacterium]